MRVTAIDNELRREVIVGGFAFAVLLGLFLFTIFVTGEVFFKTRQRVIMEFDNVMGLKNGDSVVVRGMTVGEVKELDLIGKAGKVQVVCTLQEHLKLKKDCWAVVASTTVLGGRQVQLHEGESPELLPKGVPVPGRRPSDVIDDAGKIIADIRRTLEEEGGLENFSKLVRNAREISDKINSGEGTLGKLVNDNTLYTDVAATIADARAVAAQVREGRGTIGKLVNDDSVFEDVKVAADNLRAITDRLEQGKGFMGHLLAEDDQLYDETKTMLQDVRAAVDDFRETAPILTFTSVLLGAF